MTKTLRKEIQDIIDKHFPVTPPLTPKTFVGRAIIFTATERARNLSEEFIDYFAKDIEWNLLSKWQELTEDKIEKYKDKLFWADVTMYQTMSIPFMIKHADYVYWEVLTETSCPDKEFLTLVKKCNCNPDLIVRTYKLQKIKEACDAE
jgi:hypothetical protein